MAAPKLVRDRVPVSNVRVAAATEMPDLLRDKLQEEVAEYVESGDPVELADILEVVYALADEHRIGSSGLERLRLEKAGRLGAFCRRLVWLGDDPAALRGDTP
jgi:predicted house-cleaning noncanonical NTP pyrophosphatase (MazG superfamily)